MKKLIILLLIPFTLQGQTLKDYIKKNAIPVCLMGVSGAFDGTSESLRYRYDGFKRVFPDANDQFWQPGLSWHNKWKGGDPANGEKFLFSSTALVWVTDGFHLCRMARNSTMITAIVIKRGEKKKWYWYVVDAGLYYCAYTTGFSISYNLIFK